jgi:hypothetical protein
MRNSVVSLGQQTVPVAQPSGGGPADDVRGGLDDLRTVAV